MIQLPKDFKEFLRLLEDEGVRYLLIGGYAVGCHGYPRPTGDMDIWIDPSPDNATRCAMAVRAFGMADPEVTPRIFSEERRIIRMGMPPLRIEIHTAISGVDFAACYERRVRTEVDGVPLNLISRNDLKANKRASARHRDFDDLENLG